MCIRDRYKGVRHGIEVVCRVTLPILMLLIVLLVIRGITLPGAVDGLNYLFQPDWSALKKPGVWVAAYGQIFFSLSIGFAIMVSYASYLPKKTDVVNSACITATANHGFEVFTAIGIFGIVGFMAGPVSYTHLNENYGRKHCGSARILCVYRCCVDLSDHPVFYDLSLIHI